jgi:hypothetical protein
MPEPLPWPKGRFPDGIPVRDRWLLSYAGWYRYYLSMQPKVDHHATRWAEAMADAAVSAWWFSGASGDRKIQRLQEGFAKLKETFLAQQGAWVQLALEHSQVPEPSPLDVQVPEKIPPIPEPPKKKPVPKSKAADQLSLLGL